MTKLTIPWNETFDKNKMYIWVSEKGEHTCDECKSLDGKMFFGDKIPPRPHPNCKCEVVEVKSLKENIFDSVLTKINKFPKIEHAIEDLTVSILSENKDLALAGGKIFTDIKHLPNSYEFFKIAVLKGNENYILKNGLMYSNIDEINNSELKKDIRLLTKNSNPNCRVYILTKNSDISKMVLNSKDFDKFLYENRKEIRFFNATNTKKIVFKDDPELYNIFHEATVKGFKFDEKNKKFVCRIIDYYDFSGKFSGRNRIGYELQEKGELKPFCIIMFVEVPYTRLYKY